MLLLPVTQLLRDPRGDRSHCHLQGCCDKKRRPMDNQSSLDLIIWFLINHDRRNSNQCIALNLFWKVSGQRADGCHNTGYYIVARSNENEASCILIVKRKTRCQNFYSLIDRVVGESLKEYQHGVSVQ